MPASYTYYDILGLAQGAGSAEIKAAYRQLAMQYHPDKNPSPDAHKQFVAINAAYEVLSDPLKRKIYDLRKQAGDVVFRKQRPRTANPSDPIDHEEMRRRYWTSAEGQRKRKELEEEAQLLKKVSFIFKMVSIPLFLFMFLILVERYFPKKIEDQAVVFLGSQAYGSVGNMRIEHLYELGGHSVWVKQKYKKCLNEGDRVTVHLGRIFNLVPTVELSSDCKYTDIGLSIQAKQSRLINPSEGLFAGPILLVFIVFLLFTFIWLAPVEQLVVIFACILSFIISIVILVLFLRLFP